jgi:hypothetical protein
MLRNTFLFQTKETLKERKFHSDPRISTRCQLQNPLHLYLPSFQSNYYPSLLILLILVPSQITVLNIGVRRFRDFDTLRLGRSPIRCLVRRSLKRRRGEELKELNKN